MDKHEMYLEAMGAKSPEELMKLAKKHRMELGVEESKKLYLQLHKTGKIQPDELNSVAGGSDDGKKEDDGGTKTNGTRYAQSLYLMN